MKRVLLWAAALVLGLPALALLGVVLLFDPDALRPRIEQAASQALGREVAITGGLSWRPGLRLGLGAGRVAVQGADGAPAFSLERARLSVALAPLLAGRIEVSGVELEGGVLRLDPAAWPRAPARPSAPTAAPRAEPAFALDLRDVTLRGWRLSLMGETLALPELRATSTGPGQPFALTARGEWRGLEVALTGAASGPQSSRLEAVLGRARLAAAMEPGRVGLTLTAEDLAAFSPMAGRPLELLGPVQAEASLTWGESVRLGGVALRAAPAGGSLTVTGTGEGAFDVALNLPALAPLAPLAGRPLPALTGVEARGRVAMEGLTRVVISGLSLRSSAGDLGGDLAVALGARPGVSGSLRSDRLNLAALRVPPAPAPAAPAPMAPAPSGPARVIPDAPLDLSALRGFDADLAFRLARVEDAPRVLTDAQGRFVNAAGQARLDPFAVTLPGGRLTLRAAADATRPLPAVQVAGGGQGLELAAFLAGIGSEAPSSGRADLGFDLRGQGRTTREVAASLTGFLGLAVIDGALGGNLARGLSQLNPAFAQGLPMACLALRGEAESGLMRFTTFYIEGAAGRMAGEGMLRLADEALNMRLLADLRVGGVRLRAPVPVTGTLAQPRLEGAGLLQGALGGANLPPLPDCASTLRAARGGVEGPQPTPRAAPPDPRVPVENLLRGLLGR
jgi:AsmA protein